MSLGAVVAPVPMLRRGPGLDLSYLDGEKDDGTLFIYFTSWQAEGAGKDDPLRFDFINTAIRRKQNAVLVRDRANLWYHAGIDGIPGVVNDLAAYLKKVSSGFDRVVIIGSSMGGYAALLLGFLIQADVALGIVPQIRVGHIACEGMGETRFDPWFTELDARDPTCPSYRLDSFIPQDTSTKFVTIIGEDGWIDVQHVNLLGDRPDFHRVSIKGASHNEAALACLKTGILDPVMDGRYGRSVHRLQI